MSMNWLKAFADSQKHLRPEERRQPRSVRLHLEALEDRCVPATFTVTNTNDAGAGSLRQAILDANANAGADAITFALNPAGNVFTINLQTQLTITGQVHIKGYDQTGAQANTLEQGGTNAVLKVVLSGGGQAISGLVFDGPGSAFSMVNGLVFQGFQAVNGGAVHLTGGSGGVIIGGNFFGTDPTGLSANANTTNMNAVYIDNSQLNAIGSGFRENRNLIAGNDCGIRIVGNPGPGAVIDNKIWNNLIGTDATGQAALPNKNGIILTNADAANIFIGHNLEGHRNVISGNTENGILAINSPLHGDKLMNQIMGNYIGIAADGTKVLGNGENGIRIDNARFYLIGDAAEGGRNIISGNSKSGIWLWQSRLDTGVGDNCNVIVNNYIGTDPSGTKSLDGQGKSFGNGYNGITITTSSSNLIGTDTTPNVISNNQGFGVLINNLGETGGQDRNFLSGNRIGTDKTGTVAMGNLDGVGIRNSQRNVIGGGGANLGNLISGNQEHGVSIIGVGALENIVAGNTIGLDVNGTTKLGNGLAGVWLGLGASNNLIGVPNVAGSGNIISGNGFSSESTDFGSGVLISTATANTVARNFIGTNKNGTAAIGNKGAGVYVTGQPGGNLIGGPVAEDRNIISGNGSDGVYLNSPNSVIRNYIGTDVTGNQPVPNLGSGIRGVGAAQQIRFNRVAFNQGNNITLLDSKGSLIEGNEVFKAGLHGIEITGADSQENVLIANYIGTDKTLADLGNGQNGLHLEETSKNTIGTAAGSTGGGIGGGGGGTPPGEEGNYIYYNLGSGIYSDDAFQNKYDYNKLAFNHLHGMNLRDSNISPVPELNNHIYNTEVHGNKLNGLNFVNTNWNLVADSDIHHNYQDGIWIEGSYDNQFTDTYGGTTFPIHDNGGHGITVLSGERNSFSGLRYYDNLGLAIDLGDDGMTPNDLGDPDGGPNLLQNYPVLMAAYIQNGTLFIQGYINGYAWSGYAIQLYYSATPDYSGYGEGAIPIGGGSAPTDGTGNGYFASVGIPPATEGYISAIATDGAGNTSEFSLWIAIQTSGPGGGPGGGGGGAGGGGMGPMAAAGGAASNPFAATDLWAVREEDGLSQEPTPRQSIRAFDYSRRFPSEEAWASLLDQPESAGAPELMELLPRPKAGAGRHDDMALAAVMEVPWTAPWVGVGK